MEYVPLVVVTEEALITIELAVTVRFPSAAVLPMLPLNVTIPELEIVNG